MFLEGRTSEEIWDAESRLQQHAESKTQQQDAVLHHDFDNMRREVETLGKLEPFLHYLGRSGAANFTRQRPLLASV